MKKQGKKIIFDAKEEEKKLGWRKQHNTYMI